MSAHDRVDNEDAAMLLATEYSISLNDARSIINDAAPEE